ncbi:hypothetical protein [Nitrosophilus alvini]|uniref:hypothetical protein n=1 Tax=Nitrosophilus alvini TaxID=2714855 RepID=UPI00190ABAAC|nr:hypothetical protein [Nitrosophilus alvini]
MNRIYLIFIASAISVYAVILPSSVQFSPQECMKYSYSHSGGQLHSSFKNSMEKKKRAKELAIVTKNEVENFIKKKMPNLQIKKIKLSTIRCSVVYKVIAENKVIFVDAGELKILGQRGKK